MYGSVGSLLGKTDAWDDYIVAHVDTDDIIRLKECVYAVDLHIRVHATELLATHPKLLTAYGNMGIVGICALLRETLFGFLLYITYLQVQEREQ